MFLDVLFDEKRAHINKLEKWAFKAAAIMCRIQYYTKSGNFVTRNCKLEQMSLTEGNAKDQIDHMINSKLLLGEIQNQEMTELRAKKQCMLSGEEEHADALVLRQTASKDYVQKMTPDHLVINI